MKKLHQNIIHIRSGGTHSFIDNGNEYAIRYRNNLDHILIDLYIIDKNNNWADVRITACELLPSFWSSVLTSIAEYIYYKKPKTFYITCPNQKIEKFYEHLFLFIGTIREFNGYRINKKETEFGNLYIISRDFSQTDPEFYEDIREGLNEN